MFPTITWIYSPKAPVLLLKQALNIHTRLTHPLESPSLNHPQSKHPLNQSSINPQSHLHYLKNTPSKSPHINSPTKTTPQNITTKSPALPSKTSLLLILQKVSIMLSRKLSLGVPLVLHSCVCLLPSTQSYFSIYYYVS